MTVAELHRALGHLIALRRGGVEVISGGVALTTVTMNRRQFAGLDGLRQKEEETDGELIVELT